MSKRILSLLLVLVMLVGCLASCDLINGILGNDSGIEYPDGGGDNTGNGGDNACTHEYDNGCDTTCNLCGETRTVADHADGDDEDTLCDVCKKYDFACAHEYDNACDADCNKCGGTRVPADHVYDNCEDTACNVCGLEREATHPDSDPRNGTCDACGKLLYTLETFEGEFVYKDSVGVMSNNWNPHTYQTSDESYPINFVTTGLYGFVFNDDLINYVEGKDPFAGYKIIPEMAASMPVDVTEQIKASNPEFGIPESATSGYAYTIDLNPNATWANGDPITADTYVYSMQMLLDNKYKNYRATDYMDGDFAIANAKEYYYQGESNLNESEVGIADLVKGEDGNYYSKDGWPMYIGVNAALSWLGGYSLYVYVSAYGDVYFDLTDWEALVAATDPETGLAPLNDETYPLLLTTITGNPNWGESEADAYNYLLEYVDYAPDYSFSNVGCFKSGDYQITLVLEKSLAGFNLLYNLSGNWIVYQPYYDDCMKQVEGTDAWASTYNTSLETTMSYGPYKMTYFEPDMAMTFERNENWFGYTDGQHIYQDPEDGLVYPMYQTTKITTRVVPEADTRKLMFLKGELMGYGLQAADFATYRDSEYCYVTPSETIFFFVFNGYLEAIQERENAADFDKDTTDLETMTLESFRRAWAVSFDKEAFCDEISPSRSGGYGLIGESYIYDPETGARYRDTDQAKKALCDFYSVDWTMYESLDAAVDSITGFDVEKARELYAEAFTEALEAGYITDADGDGKSDQTVTITYSASDVTDFIKKTIQYFNDRLAEVLVGTPFEGKIVMVASAPLGDPAWSDDLKAGLTDTCLCGWSGSALNPFSLTDLYTNPTRQYDAKWFNAASVDLTLEVNVAGIGNEPVMKEVTMNLKNWSDALNGSTVTARDNEDYCFGDGIADVETRLDILGAIEAEILSTYNYIPMLQDGSMALLSKQVYYVVEDYNPVMGRGGITYLKYNYEESAWTAYVASQGGNLAY